MIARFKLFSLLFSASLIACAPPANNPSVDRFPQTWCDLERGGVIDIYLEASSMGDYPLLANDDVINDLVFCSLDHSCIAAPITLDLSALDHIDEGRWCKRDACFEVVSGPSSDPNEADTYTVRAEYLPHNRVSAFIISVDGEIIQFDYSGRAYRACDPA